MFKLSSISSLLVASTITTTAIISMPYMAHAKTQLTLWTWSPSFPVFNKQFEKRHPNIHIKVVMFPYATYKRKIMTIMRAPKNGPDLFTSHISFVQDMIKYKLYKPLPQFNKYKDDFMPYVWHMATDSKGTVYAGSYESTPGSFIYNRDLAKQVYGTDDPKIISDKFSTWDKYLKNIDIVQKKLKRNVKFMDSMYTLVGMVQSKYKEPLVDENHVLNTGKMITELFTLHKKIAKRDAFFKLGTSNYITQLIMNKNLFGVVEPAWFIKGKIGDLVPKYIGHWALVSGPQSYSRGGSFLGVNPSLNDKEKLKAVNLYMYELFYNVDTSTELVKAISDMPGNYKVLEKMKDVSSDILGGQKYLKVVAAKAKDIYLNPTPYDNVLVEQILSNIGLKIVANPKLSIPDLIAMYKKSAKENFPELIVK